MDLMPNPAEIGIKILPKPEVKSEPELQEELKIKLENDDENDSMDDLGDELEQSFSPGMLTIFYIFELMKYKPQIMTQICMTPWFMLKIVSSHDTALYGF